MNPIEILGLIAGTLTTIAFVPQVWKTWRQKSARDLSLTMLIVFCAGVFLWLIYGLYRQSVSIVLANFVTLLLAAVNLMLKLKYERLGSDRQTQQKW